MKERYFRAMDAINNACLFVAGAFLVVIDHVHRLTALVRAIDSRIDERLLEGLVVLQEPLREQRMA